MSELTPASYGRRLDLDTAGKPHPPTQTTLDCEGCPVAAGEVPDASCAECIVTVFLAAERWPTDSA